jgi:hypothetical protein
MLYKLEDLTAQERFHKLMEQAAELTLALRKITEPVHMVINALIEEADSLKLEAADEHDAARGIVTRKLGTKRLHDKAQKSVPETTVNDDGDEVTVRRRKCSKCHQPGHTAKTCDRRKK